MPDVTFTIAEPCHENWQNMTPNEQGRFCNSCKKDVVDFSVMTDEQVYTALLKGDANMCGRLSNKQLEKGIRYAVVKRNYWYKYVIGFLFPVLLYTKQASAQKGMIAISPDVKTQSKNGKLNPVLTVKDFEFSGKILDATTNELIGNGIITIKETGKEILIGEKGSFTITSKTSNSTVTVAIEALGYQSREMVISIPANNFIMKEETIYLRRKIIPLENVTILSNSTELGRLSFIAGGISSCVRTTRASNWSVKVKTALTDSLKIYPNPVSKGNEMKVAIKLKKPGSYTLQIIDLSGKLIYQQTVKSADKQSVSKVQCESAWSSGVYVMRILGSAGDLISVARFVVK